VLRNQGHYEEAEQIYREVVQVREKVLGKEHPSRLTSMNNLALVLSNQGKYKAAEQMYYLVALTRYKEVINAHLLRLEQESRVA
jgi:hypothetical protein